MEGQACMGTGRIASREGYSPGRYDGGIEWRLKAGLLAGEINYSLNELGSHRTEATSLQHLQNSIGTGNSNAGTHYDQAKTNHYHEQVRYLVDQKPFTHAELIYYSDLIRGLLEYPYATKCRIPALRL